VTDRRRLAGRYALEAPLGAGGMGSIFRGTDERLGQPVAVKILKRALVDDPVLRERFRREALSLSKLRAVPGIVGVLDFGEADGDLFTVLELVSGETLERSVGAPMALARAAAIVDQILAALATCHDSGIVHRDVKPANVIVSNGADEPVVTLIDFGLARLSRIAGDSIAKLTETGAVQGTPHYMAPEQCRGEDVGPPSDIYATGVVFYELLAGTNPYQGRDAATFMAQHLFVEPPPLREIAPHVPAGVAAVVHAMLQKRPEDRPTAPAARRAIAAALTGADPEAAAASLAAHRTETAGLSRSARSLGESARTSGLACTAATTDGPPSLGDRDVVVVSVADGIERVRQLRATNPDVPLVVVDVGSPEHTTEAIRAGASDMLLREAPDADLAGKVRRLLRRRARR
jgi:serine/threonine-protein kinase